MGGHAGALLTDLSKTFDCIEHELLIVKVHAYSFDTDALKFISAYLKGRKQSTEINSSYTSFAEFFLLYLKDQFLCHYYLTLTYVIFFTILVYYLDIDYNLDFISFAHDNTAYSCLSDMISAFGQLKGGIDKIFDRFKNVFL